MVRMGPDSRDAELPAQVSGRIGYLLSRLGVARQRRFVAALAPLGIRPGHYGALKLIEAHGPVSQQTLADGLRMDRSVVVGAVDHLGAAGAVQRRPDPADRRRHALHLTARGRDLIREGDAVADRLHEQWLAPLNTEQREQLLRLLGMLTKAHLHADPRGRGR